MIVFPQNKMKRWHLRTRGVHDNRFFADLLAVVVVTIKVCLRMMELVLVDEKTQAMLINNCRRTMLSASDVVATRSSQNRLDAW